MKIFNTLSKKVEEFIPNEEGKVKMYTCGPTVYSYAHIGNLRTYISEDILGLRKNLSTARHTWHSYSAQNDFLFYCPTVFCMLI